MKILLGGSPGSAGDLMCLLQLETRCKELWGIIAVSLGHSSIQCTCAILRATLEKIATKVKMRDVMCISCALPRLLGCWRGRDNPQAIYLFTNPIKPMSHDTLFLYYPMRSNSCHQIVNIFGIRSFFGKTT